MKLVVLCTLCQEAIKPTEDGGSSFAMPRHRECAVRMVVGGIGHLLDHNHFCLRQHDPDAGLTYRQSALLVDQWVVMMGVEEAAKK